MKKNEIKILHIIDHMGLGGAQTIIKKLVEENENHYLFSLRKAKNQIKFSSKENKRIKILNDDFKSDLSALWELKKFVSKNKINVLHAHLAKSIFIVYLYKTLFKNDLKIVINEHGAVFSKKRWFYRFLLRRISKFTTSFIAVSNQTKKALIHDAKLNPKKIDLVYNFIDFNNLEIISEKEKLNLRKSLNLRKKDFLIGFVGRLSGVKNIDILIDTFIKIKDDNTKLLLIGDGELKSELQKQAQNNKNILFLGFREDVKQLYQILDVIVLPSSSEASPMAFYESQVYAIPFIGSNVYAINEFIKDGFNGFLFKFRDISELEKKLILVRDNEKIRNKIKKNAISNLSQYDIKLYKKKLTKIYNR